MSPKMKSIIGDRFVGCERACRVDAWATRPPDLTTSNGKTAGRAKLLRRHARLELFEPVEDDANLGRGLGSGLGLFGRLHSANDLAVGSEVVVPLVAWRAILRKKCSWHWYGIAERKARLGCHADGSQCTRRGDVEQLFSVRRPDRVMVNLAKIVFRNLIFGAGRRERLDVDGVASRFVGVIRDPSAI